MESTNSSSSDESLLDVVFVFERNTTNNHPLSSTAALRGDENFSPSLTLQESVADYFTILAILVSIMLAVATAVFCVYRAEIALEKRNLIRQKQAGEYSTGCIH